jgi:O-antigen/teichoic acid export membrane protein
MLDRYKKLAKKLSTGIFWVSLATILFRGNAIVASIGVSFAMKGHPEDLAVLITLQSLAILAQSVIGYALMLTATRYTAEASKSSPDAVDQIAQSITIMSIAWATLAIIAGLLFQGLLTSSLKITPDHASLTAFFCIASAFMPLLSAELGILTGLEKFRLQSIVSAVVAPVMILPPVLGALALGAKGAAIGFALAPILAWLGMITYRIRFLNIGGKKLHPINLRPVLLTTLPALIAGILMQGTMWLVNPWAANYGASLKELSVWNLANQWRATILFIPMQIYTASLPYLVKESHTNKSLDKKLMLTMMGINVASASIVLIPLAIASHWILSILYDPSYLDFKTTFIVALLSTIPMVLSFVVTQTLVVEERAWLITLFNIVFALTFIALSRLLIPSHHTLGGALAGLGAYLTLSGLGITTLLLSKPRAQPT